MGSDSSSFVQNGTNLYCLRSIITNDTRFTIQDVHGKSGIHQEEDFFTRKLDLNLRKKLIKFYTWSIAFYGAETWKLLKIDQKYMKSSEIWCFRSMEYVIWTDRVRNEPLHGLKEEIISYLQ